MGQPNHRAKEIRETEQDAVIDPVSEGARRLCGIDPETFRILVAQAKTGRQKWMWGLQAVESPDKTSDATAPEDIAAIAGSIDGWPLDPDLYTKDGLVQGEDYPRNGNPVEHAEGIVNGMDYRGMVPGAIPGVQIDPAAGDDVTLNIP